MDVTVRKPWIKVGVLLSFLVMITVNALANAQDQGEIQKVEYEIIKDREIKLPLSP